MQSHDTHGSLVEKKEREIDRQTDRQTKRESQTDRYRERKQLDVELRRMGRQMAWDYDVLMLRRLRKDKDVDQARNMARA